MRPRLFIGSSTEGLEIAYAAQENLEHYSEITVWTQGIFQLSKYNLEALIDALDEFDFGLFVFTPDDIAIIREAKQVVARDNVVFELGLFIGRLGRERSFILIPRGHEDFHLPTDLLGITPATYEADRKDENFNAALGPACNRIRKAMQRFGPLRISQEDETVEYPEPSEFNDNDCISILESWMGSRTKGRNLKVMQFDQVDRELGLPKGSAEKFLEMAAKRWGYLVARKGNQTILFE